MPHDMIMMNHGHTLHIVNWDTKKYY